MDHTRSGPFRPKSRRASPLAGSEPRSALRALAGLVCAALLLVPSGLAAQNDGRETEEASDNAGEDATSASRSSTTDVILWLFRDSGLEAEPRETFRRALGEALSDAKRRHLLSKKDLSTYLEARSASIPPCLTGLEPCISPQTLLFDELELNALVRIRVRRAGDGYRVRYRLVGRRGETTKKATIEGDEPKELAFSLVRELFDATGTVAIRSEPSGASVRIDGETAGTTPLETRLPIGRHTFRLEHRNREPIDGEFELASGRHATIDRRLSRKPGRLLVENAPEGASVYIGDERKGAAGESIELDPGRYQVSVRADGYESYEETVEIGAGESVQRSVPLESKSSILRDIAADAIAVNHYVARLTFDQSVHPTSFRDARGSAGGTRYEFQGFTSRGGGLPGDRVVRQTLAPRGLRIDAGYTGRNFGVVAMSLSYAATRADHRASFEVAGESDRDLLGTVTGLRRLQLRPLQVTYRRFFKNFVPSLELGTGITFQWLSVEGLREETAPPVLFHQTEAFWTLGVTGQYFFNPNWFALLRYSFQDYFNAGKGVEHVISLGAGVAYPDIFGFAPEPPEEL